MGDVHFLNDDDEMMQGLTEKMVELVEQLKEREIDCMVCIGWKKDDPEVFIRMVPCDNLNKITRMVGMMEVLKSMLLFDCVHGEEED